MQTCSVVVEFSLIGDSGDCRAEVDSKGDRSPNR